MRLPLDGAQIFRGSPWAVIYNAAFEALEPPGKGVRQLAAGLWHFAILPSCAEDGKTRPRRRGFPTIERPHGEISIS